MLGTEIRKEMIAIPSTAPCISIHETFSDNSNPLCFLIFNKLEGKRSSNEEMYQTTQIPLHNQRR